MKKIVQRYLSGVLIILAIVTIIVSVSTEMKVDDKVHLLIITNLGIISGTISVLHRIWKDNR